MLAAHGIAWNLVQRRKIFAFYKTKNKMKILQSTNITFDIEGIYDGAPKTNIAQILHFFNKYQPKNI